MSGESINVAISSATLIVIGAASVAALIQLRHLRASNQLNGLMEIMNQWNVPSVQEALAEVQRIPEKMKDPEYVAMLNTPGAASRARYVEFLAMDLWEQIGAYSKRGLIDESILLDVTSSQVSIAWKCAEPLIAVLRARSGPSVLENFEYLAVRAELWTRRYPNGTYPPGKPRMSDL